MQPLTVLLLLALAGVFLAWYVTYRRLGAARQQSAGLSRQVEECRGLQKRIETLQSLLKVVHSVLLLVDEDHHVVYSNAAAHRLFEMEVRDIPSTGDSLMAITRHHELDDIVRLTLENESDEGVGYQIVLQGRTYRVQARRVTIGGKPHVALVLEDISELQRLGRARRDMVANISHELRTPITSIRLLTDTLQRGALSDPRRGPKLLQKIVTEVEFLEQMAQELLDLSMIESGRVEIRLVPVELAGIIREAVGHFSEQAARKDVTIEGLAPPHLMVLADPDQVGRVLNNLLHNAIKFTPPGGIIEVSVALEGEWVCVAVSDTGPGIPEEERERIFERFYRGDRARQGSGTGLGLAIAKHIVEGHGGKIWAEQASPSGGARICFTLPTASL